MTFTPGTKIYVRYSTGITQAFTECLTISRYKNNLLYFKEKTAYYAVECHTASFYGFSYNLAGNVIAARHKWQIPFAAAAEKLKFIVPVRQAKAASQPAIKMRLQTEVS